MPSYASDMLYALKRLGLSETPEPAAIFTALAEARQYRLIAPQRLKEIRDIEAFLKARRLFGPLALSETELRRAYHAKALALHPDLGPQNKTAEDELKSLNAAWHLLQQTERRAKAYFKLPESTRRVQEDEARQARAHEAPQEPLFSASSARAAASPMEPPPAHARRTYQPPPPSPAPRGAYIAASVPRFIRQARLPQLPLQAIIGTRQIGNMTYDIIMLPEKEFSGALARLAAADPTGSPDLSPGRLIPAYSPRDRVAFTPPEGVSDGVAVAKEYFLKAFKLRSVQSS